MAIDSERKRKSIAAVSLQSLGPVVVPDGSFIKGDRLAIGYSYFGVGTVTAEADDALVITDTITVTSTGDVFATYVYVSLATIGVPKATGAIGVPKATATITP